MLNLAAGILIVVSSVFLGASVKSMYDLRVKIAEELYRFINFSQGEISFYRTELDSLIKKYVSENDSEFAGVLRAIKPSGESAAEGIKNPHMAKSTKRLTAEFLRGVANLDRASLGAHIETYLVYVGENIAALKSDSELKGKTFKKLSPVLGIAAFILII